MRREKNDLAPDPFAREESFEQLLAPAFRADHDVLKLQKMLEQEPVTADRMIGTEQTTEVVGEQSLLKEIGLLEVGE